MHKNSSDNIVVAISKLVVARWRVLAVTSLIGFILGSTVIFSSNESDSVVEAILFTPHEEQVVWLNRGVCFRCLGYITSDRMALGDLKDSLDREKVVSQALNHMGFDDFVELPGGQRISIENFRSRLSLSILNGSDIHPTSLQITLNLGDLSANFLEANGQLLVEFLKSIDAIMLERRISFLVRNTEFLAKDSNEYRVVRDSHDQREEVLSQGAFAVIDRVSVKSKRELRTGLNWLQSGSLGALIAWLISLSIILFIYSTNEKNPG